MIQRAGRSDSACGGNDVGIGCGCHGLVGGRWRLLGQLRETKGSGDEGWVVMHRQHGQSTRGFTKRVRMPGCTAATKGRGGRGSCPPSNGRGPCGLMSLAQLALYVLLLPPLHLCRTLPGGGGTLAVLGQGAFQWVHVSFETRCSKAMVFQPQPFEPCLVPKTRLVPWLPTSGVPS